MLSVVSAFQQRYKTEKPIIVADSAMLSQANRDALDNEGYHYIVGARLANAKPSFLVSVCNLLGKDDGATIRLSYPGTTCDIVCAYSQVRYKKDKRELDKQIEKAKMLVARNEPGRRAKFVNKSHAPNKHFVSLGVEIAH